MTSTTRQRLMLAASVIVLLLGIGASWAAGRGGVDFPSLYVIGRGVLTGTNIYAPGATADFPTVYGVDQPMGMFYPPATGFTMLPFAMLPYGVAKFLWFVVMDLVLVLGVRQLVRVAAPRAETRVWVFCAGVILLSSTLRWSMILLQGAPLVFGLLCLFIAAEHDERPRLATALAVLAVAVKMTLSLPFLGILLLRRRLLAVVAAGGTWVLLNVAGFARMGSGALREYRQNVGQLEAFGNINAPDPWNPISLPRLDWTSLIYGLTANLKVAHLASLVLSALLALGLLWLGFRAANPKSLRTTALFLPPLVCLGSMCVYHHHYDACLFFAPALLAYFNLGDELRPKWALLLAAPLLLMILVLPIGVVQRLANDAFGVRGIGLLKLSFPIATNLMLAGSLALLLRHFAQANGESVGGTLPGNQRLNNGSKIDSSPPAASTVSVGKSGIE